MALAFLLAATTATFRPARAEPTRSAEHTSKHPSLVTFTLVRGGRAAADYGLFTSSRQCLRDAIGDAVDYDDVAFHEGNVPLGIQMTLHLEMCASPTLLMLVWSCHHTCRLPLLLMCSVHH